MSPVRRAYTDFRDAARAFSRPARFYLLAEFMMWTAHGIFSVLFNLYLVEAGFAESFIGRAISVNALGLALTALPAGLLADRWGRRKSLMLGAVLEACGHLLRASTTHPGVIIGAGFVVGAGQSMFQIAAAPFLTEHSSPKERTHLFSSFFACSLLAGVLGSAVGGAIPHGFRVLQPAWSLFTTYRLTLVVGAFCAAGAIVPLLAMGRVPEQSLAHEQAPVSAADKRKLYPIALNAMLIGMGAGLVIPFMNLYFKDRFHCSSTQIGTFFSIAQVFTAIASLLGPAIARHFGKLRTAVASELLSLPFLVTLGAERHLPTAVVSFWLRATFMQASTPLVQAFIMETLPPALRARSTSIANMVWNLGWAVSATMAGLIIERFGFAMPFYMTATLYAIAALTFLRAFWGTPETNTDELRLSEEAKGRRGEGAATE